MRKSDGKILTQARMSAMSGVDRSAISRYLSGDKVPTIKTAMRIATACGVPVQIFTSPHIQKAYFGKVYLREFREDDEGAAQKRD